MCLTPSLMRWRDLVQEKSKTPPLPAEDKKAAAPHLAQRMTNYWLVNHGIHSAPHRELTLEVRTRLRICLDCQVFRACTSPRAPTRNWEKLNWQG